MTEREQAPASALQAGVRWIATSMQRATSETGRGTPFGEG